MLTLQCLTELGNIRSSIFQNDIDKANYIKTFSENLNYMLHNESIMNGSMVHTLLPHHAILMRHNSLFRECLKLIHKYWLNFGLGAIANAGK